MISHFASQIASLECGFINLVLRIFSTAFCTCYIRPVHCICTFGWYVPKIANLNMQPLPVFSIISLIPTCLITVSHILCRIVNLCSELTELV